MIDRWGRFWHERPRAVEELVFWALAVLAMAVVSGAFVLGIRLAGGA